MGSGRGRGLATRALDGVFNFGRRVIEAGAHVFATNDPGFLDAFFGFGRKTAAGIFINPAKSMEIGAYYACIRNISEDVGKLPLFLFSSRVAPERGRDRLRDHALSRLITLEPNPNMTKMTFWELIVQWALAWGNGYAEIQRDNRGRPVQLNPIHPTNVTIKQDEDGNIFYEVRGKNMGEMVQIAPFNMIHIRGLGNVHDGFSTTDLASETLGLAAAQQTTASTFFGNNAMISGVLEHPDTLDEEAAKGMRKSWDQIHGGPKRSNKIAILWEGMKFNPITMPFRDAELIASRKFSVEEIARWFRMPPHKIGHLEKATNNNIESQGIDYVTHTLLSWLIRIEMEVDRKLLDGEGPLFVEHQVQGLLRGDTAARANFYKALFNMAAISPNEIREFENLNPFAGGDKHYLGVNLMAIDTGPVTGAITGDAAGGRPDPNPDMSGDLQPVIRSIVSRLSRKESRALERAAEKPDAETVKAVGKFYYAFRGDMKDAFTPICDSYGGDNANIYKSAMNAWADSFKQHHDKLVNPAAACPMIAARMEQLKSGNHEDIITDEICSIFKNISGQLVKTGTAISLITEK